MTNLGDAGTLFSKDDKPLSISATRWHAYRYTENSSTNSVVLKDFWSCENHCTNLTACSTLNETAIPCPVKHAAVCERVSMTVPLCGDSKSKVERWPIPKFFRTNESTETEITLHRGQTFWTTGPPFPAQDPQQSLAISLIQAAVQQWIDSRVGIGDEVHGEHDVIVPLWQLFFFLIIV